MSGFSADWLAQRESFDSAARAHSAAALDLPGLASDLRARRVPGEPIDVIDLACGTGANLRELAPRLGGRQRWRLVDHDPALLAALPVALAGWAGTCGHDLQQVADAAWRVQGERFEAEVCLQTLDLTTGLDRLPFGESPLVTASALLDLVSADWLDALVAQCVQNGAAMLFALNVDGRHDWSPRDPDDDAVHQRFAAHQRRDKGFGPALGPHAAARLERLLQEAGYRVRRAESDWTIDARDGPASRAMLAAMVEGIAAAAEQAGTPPPVVSSWSQRRLQGLDRSRLAVGHVDVLALPPSR